MKTNGAAHVDYTIRCHECGKLLRDSRGTDIEEIHTDSNDEDVCEDCCDVCKMEDAAGDLEDYFAAVF